MLRLRVLVLALRLLVLVLLLLLLVLTLLVIRVLEVVLVLTPPTAHLLRPHIAHVELDPVRANLVRIRPTHIYPPTSTVHRPLRASTLAAAHTPLRAHANTRRLSAT